MGKYFGSPWGSIRGKLDDAVGGYWKGIEWNRVRVYPTQRGTLALKRQLDEGLIPAERFSYPQFNIRRCVLSPLGAIARQNLITLVYPVWEDLCSKRKLALTGSNLFIKKSVTPFWESMPDHNAEYDENTNAPNAETIVISDGNLEPIPSITGWAYDLGTGNNDINWDTAHYQNGADNDHVHWLVYVEPIFTVGYEPNGWLYGDAREVLPPGLPIRRSDGSASFTTAPGLTAVKMVLYLFARDDANTIGHSRPAVLRGA